MPTFKPNGSGTSWQWYSDEVYSRGKPCDLPKVLFDALPVHTSSSMALYDSEAEALAAYEVAVNTVRSRKSDVAAAYEPYDIGNGVDRWCWFGPRVWRCATRDHTTVGDGPGHGQLVIKSAVLPDELFDALDGYWRVAGTDFDTKTYQTKTQAAAALVRAVMANTPAPKPYYHSHGALCETWRFFSPAVLDRAGDISKPMEVAPAVLPQDVWDALGGRKIWNDTKAFDGEGNALAALREAQAECASKSEPGPAQPAYAPFYYKPGLPDSVWRLFSPAINDRLRNTRYADQPEACVRAILPQDVWDALQGTHLRDDTKGYETEEDARNALQVALLKCGMKQVTEQQEQPVETKPDTQTPVYKPIQLVFGVIRYAWCSAAESTATLPPGETHVLPADVFAELSGGYWDAKLPHVRVYEHEYQALRELEAVKKRLRPPEPPKRVETTVPLAEHNRVLEENEALLRLLHDVVDTGVRVTEFDCYLVNDDLVQEIRRFLAGYDEKKV